MKKRILSLLLAGAMVCTAAVPTFADDEVETLTMLTYVDWYGEGLKAVENYINENSDELGFKLEVQQITGGAEGDEMLAARTATDDLPDILNTYGAYKYFNSSGGKGKLLPLDGLESVSEYNEDVLSKSFYTVDGTLYGMPFGTTYYYGNYYNKKVLEQAGVEEYPKSWDEFLEACEKVKAIGITPVYISAADTWTTGLFANLSFSKEMIDRGMEYSEFCEALNTNQIKFAECENVMAGCAKAKELIDKGYVQETYLSDTYDMAQSALANGECAFYVCAHAVMSEIASKYPDKVNDIGGNMLPMFEEEDNRLGMGSTTILGVTTVAENPELAKKAVDFMCSAKAVEIYSQAQPGLYINTKIKVDSLPAFEEQMECPAEMVPSFKYDLAGCIQTSLIDYLIGAKELEEIGTTLDSECARCAEAAGDENWVK